MTKYTQEQLSLLCDPKAKKPLHLIEEDNKSFLIDESKTVKYPIVDDIIRVLNQDDVAGRNKRYQGLYDKIAWWYSPVQRIVNTIYRGKKWLFHKQGDVQRPFLSELAIKSSDKILEVSVGTGDNLEVIPVGASFYGLDISIKMLNHCRKTSVRKKIPAVLVHGMAEELPFLDNSFDVVLHVGGINFFTNKAQAIQEMIRVAKPGAKILISDETEEAAKWGENKPIAKWFFANRDEVITPPVDLIPKDMKDINLKMTHENSLYVITFTKP
jgi:ubiquinone/menaquinone biosynthesis C-methylase UbiE